MSHVRWWIASVASISLMAVFVTTAIDHRSHAASTQRGAVAIEHAVSIAERAARKWRSNAKLQFITSQDVPGEEIDDNVPGSDGARRAWALQFVDPDTHQFVIVQVSDGVVMQVLEGGRDDKPSLDTHDFHVSGRAVATQATREGLLPRKGWAVGYHFRFTYDFPTRRHLLTILGVNRSGLPFALQFDAVTGQLVQALPN